MLDFFLYWSAGSDIPQVFLQEDIFCKWLVASNDCYFEPFKIIILLKYIFLHKPV